MASVKLYLKRGLKNIDSVQLSQDQIRKNKAYNKEIGRIPTRVFAVLRDKPIKDIKIYSDESVEPLHWNPNDQKVRASDTKAPEVNQRLHDFKNNVLIVYNRLRIAGELITPERIRTELDNLNEEHNIKTSDEFFEFINEFTKDSGSVKKDSTVTVYKTTASHLKDYQVHQQVKLTFEAIDLNFYNSFVNYLLHQKSLSNNSIGKYVKTIKTFMNEAFERGLTKNIAFRSKKFKVYQEETDSIYLNLDELERMYQLDLTNDQRLERVRDLFILEAFTGVRYSDIPRLLDNNVSNGIITLRMQKTGRKVSIPMHPKVKAILEKYDFVLPKIPSNQKMNQYLKEVGQLTELNNEVTIRSRSGAKERVERLPKYELIKTHTGRRSFATNAYLEGVSSLQIMRITGHRTEKAFMRYLKIHDESSVGQMINHPFFS